MLMGNGLVRFLLHMVGCHVICCLIMTGKLHEARTKLAEEDALLTQPELLHDLLEGACATGLVSGKVLQKAEVCEPQVDDQIAVCAKMMSAGPTGAAALRPTFEALLQLNGKMVDSSVD